jgi:uncharacterized protein (UPF0335 family)
VSVSCEQNQPTQSAFNALEHLAELCVGTRVTIDDLAEVDYPKGWATLIGIFIEEICQIPVRIKRLERENAQLEIYFETKLQRHEVKVWRLIYEMRRQAQFNCIECGTQISQGKGPSRGCCFACKAKRSKVTKTGTWMDKYISEN